MLSDRCFPNFAMIYSEKHGYQGKNSPEDKIMKKLLVPMLMVAALLSACAAQAPASRSVAVGNGDLTLATQGRATPGATEVRQVLAAQYHVVDVKISVPQSLRVSEANVFYPIADIVWRGEPIGNRHTQVASIFREAATKATVAMTKGPQVVVDLEVTRFHSVTEKTRYTVGGTHSMHFQLTVLDAQTGAIIDGPRAIVADVKAAGGAQAVAEEQMGRTQRVVVVERLMAALRQALSRQVTDPLVVSQALIAHSTVQN